jgi:hypothetical protein
MGARHAQSERRSSAFDSPYHDGRDLQRPGSPHTGGHHFNRRLQSCYSGIYQPQRHGLRIRQLDLDVVNLARDLLERYPLRAYDAVQLASALVANQALQDAQLSPLVFASADDRLNTAATAEGLGVENPNYHH